MVYSVRVKYSERLKERDGWFRTSALYTHEDTATFHALSLCRQGMAVQVIMSENENSTTWLDLMNNVIPEFQ
jgi:hypothetical protein